MKPSSDPEAPRRALVIDDDAAHRRLLTDTLTPAGFSVETASSGEEGLERLRAARFDIVLCDMIMPGMGGLRALRAIKKSFPGLPVIILTGQATVHTAVEAIESGAHHYIRKPYDVHALRQIVREAVGY